MNKQNNKLKQEEEEFGNFVQQQRTINLMKQQKQMASQVQDLEKINQRARKMQAQGGMDGPPTEKHDISISINDS